MSTPAVNSTEQDIIKELARLRMWRDVANADECKAEDEAVHERINKLLDALDAQRQRQRQDVSQHH